MSIIDFRPENSDSFKPKTLEHLEPETSESPTEDRLAELAGFDTDLDESGDLSDPTTTIKKNSPLLSDEELEEQITRHSFASSPLSKLIFVAGGMFVIVFIVSLFLAHLQPSSDSVSAAKNDSPEEKKLSKLLSEDHQDKEKGELLSELALKEQKEHLKALRGNRVQTANSVKKIPVATSTTPYTTVSANPTPVRQVQPQPQLQPQIAYYPQKSSPRYKPSTRSYFPIPRPSSSLITQANQIDSTQSWKQLSEIGSFGASTSSNPNPSSTSTRPNFNMSYSSNNPSRSLPKNQSRPFVTASTESTSEVPLNSNAPQAITFGQFASGVLETTIAWEKQGFYSNQNEKSDDQYVVILNQPLKDKSGKEQIPAGSKIIVRLDVKTTALVTLIAESVLINGVTIPLPQGVLKIRTPDGQPLVAEIRTVGGSGGNNDNSLNDLLSVFGGSIPGLNSLSGVNRLLGGGNYQRYSASTTIYFLQKDTNLQIFVNKAFSLANSTPSEEPLELDIPN